jgi:CubicO group peptidase (beta-lactamase class C family)
MPLPMKPIPRACASLAISSPPNQFKIVHEPAGSIHTTANDLAQWLKALLQNGAPLLQPNTFNELTTPQVVMQDVLNSELAPLAYLQPATHFWTYALGWWAMDYRGEKVLMHGGQMPGYNSAVAFFPQRKLALAVMVNVHQTLAHAALFYAIADILLDKKTETGHPNFRWWRRDTWHKSKVKWTKCASRVTRTCLRPSGLIPSLGHFPTTSSAR